MRDTIFISYRTDDGGWAADLIYSELIESFDEADVFLDSVFAGNSESIPRCALERSAVVLTVIGPHWLTDQSDRKRIDDPDDPVRTEIDRALTLGVPVIPVLLDATPLPPPFRLPERLRELSFRRPLPMRKRERVKDLRCIVEALSYILDRPAAGVPVRPYSTAALIAFALANVIAVVVALALATELRYSVDAWMVGVGGALLSVILFALGLFDVRPGGWRSRMRLWAHARTLPSGPKQLLSGLRSQVRRLRWPKRPAGWMYVGCCMLITMAGVAVATAPAARCIGEGRRAFGFETGGTEGWYIRAERGLPMGTALSRSDEHVKDGGGALRFDFDNARLDRGQIAVDRMVIGGMVDGWAWVGAEAPAPLTATAYAIEEIASSSGTQWILHRADPVRLAPGAWTHLSFGPSDFTRSSSDPPHPSPPLLGFEIRSVATGALGISSSVYFDDITVC